MKRHVWRGLLALSLLAVVVAVASLGGAGTVAAGEDGLAKAIAAQEGHTDTLLAKAGVVGTAIGLGPDGKPAVYVLTEKPGVRGIPQQVDGVTVVPQVTGKIVARAPKDPECKGPPSQRPEWCGNGEEPTPTPSPTPPPLHPDAPVRLGASTGSERLISVAGQYYCTVGTLGGPVTDGVNTYALSNAHVYALEGSKTVGKVQTGPDGDRVLSPGRVDMVEQACGSTGEIDAAVLGRLDSFQKIRLGGRRSNRIDAAIALAPAGNLTLDSLSYGAVSTGIVNATPGLAVQKHGRTTGLTTGLVTGVNATILVQYDKGVAKFVNQVMIGGGAFSDGGDSGSLIVTQAGNNPVALLFAGSSTATFGNPIDEVLSHFGVTIGVGSP